MPTVVTIPLNERTKHVKAGAPYSPSQSLNPAMDLLVGGCAGILSGMGISVNVIPSPAQITVSPGNFIQNGIIVDVTSSVMVEAPSSPTYPLYLVAENTDEVNSSDVKYQFTTSPNADSLIIAFWLSAPLTTPSIPAPISNCALRDAIGGVSPLVVQHDRQVMTLNQTVVTLAPTKAYVTGSNKLLVHRNGKKLEVNFDYTENTSTQFTLANLSLAGDVIDIIVFQGAPPITSIALGSLVDVTTDLANAIKDVSTLRAALATASNPLATIQDIVSLIGSIPPAGLHLAEGFFSSIPLGDFIVPTGFTPKLVIAMAAHAVEPFSRGATSIGFATGLLAGQQYCLAHYGGDNHRYGNSATGFLLNMPDWLGSFGPLQATVTQMDVTQVKVTVTANSAAFGLKIFVLG